jgi:hypothetical protein
MPRSRTALRRLARLNRLLSRLSPFESPTSARKWFRQRGPTGFALLAGTRKRLTNPTCRDNGRILKLCLDLGRRPGFMWPLGATDMHEVLK